MQHFVLPGNPLVDSEAWSDWMSAFDDLLQEGEPPAA
jgi:hypothetical protein